MTQTNRRQFLVGAGTAVCAASVFSRRIVRGAESKEEIAPPPLVQLGSTGIRLSRVAQGTGTHGWRRQSNHTRMGFEKFVALMRHAFERGIRFFDLADLYGTHVYFREALRFIPRDEITILSKLWWRDDGPTRPKAEPWRKRVALATIERFLQEIATDRIEILLLHCVTSDRWDTELEPYMEALDEAKEQGKVRAVGVSCHSLPALQVAARCSWADVILARINPAGVKMDGTPEQIASVLTEARKNGKAVVGMKILGEGRLVERKEQCVQYAQENGLLDAMTIGFERPSEIDECLRLLRRYPAKPLL